MPVRSHMPEKNLLVKTSVKASISTIGVNTAHAMPSTACL